MTTPVPGDIFAAYSHLGDCYTAYQFIRYQETKANQLATTHILPFTGFYPRLDDIDIHQLTLPPMHMMSVGGQPHQTAFHAIESLHGYIPKDHVRIGHLPLIADTRPVIYGGNMNAPAFIPQEKRVPPYDRPTDVSAWLHDEVFDLAAFAAAQPQARVLVMRGVTIAHFEQVVQLSKLRFIAFFDVRIEAATIPDLSLLPDLNLVWMVGVPHDIGSAMKKQLQTLARQQPQRITYEITQLRKPEWYAAHDDNPLFFFTAAEHIPPKEAKKAVRIYRDTLKQALALPAATWQAGLERLAAAYAAAFNRFAWIETEERELLCTAYWQIAHLAAEKHGAEADLEAVQEAIDRVRDW
ncbi:hypothetical protein [uncultured Cardiobacterium sp.]|uniref:hypothetical protein n=1 Tax=uncultured Cardiobacterium sp. TaxID=417619 RepID=UPI002612DE26|nr:hypothetical protein [uncultured Cardiobacterium sp.]